MKTFRSKLPFVLAVTTVLFLLALAFLYRRSADVLNPAGVIGSEQKNLIVFTFVLSLIVIVPVYVLTFLIVWRYRASNTKAAYRPNWDGNKVLETIWWGIPCAIIGILAIVTWQTSHSLDPFKPLASTKKPITIQVIALEWKWLFIYPEQHIASVNYVQFPVDTPVNFVITSDAPMNSFWIPKLGSQIYAMSGMSTQLHMMATEQGNFKGSSANISGEGFSGMHFIAKSSSYDGFRQFVDQTQKTHTRLDLKAYDELALPSENVKPVYFSDVQNGLYDSVINKYMGGHAAHNHTHEAEAH